MTKTVDFSKHIWEGWTVQDFIEELEPVLDIIQAGKSWHKPMTTRKEITDYCKDNQPYYKGKIPEVVDYFAKKYNIN